MWTMAVAVSPHDAEEKHTLGLTLKRWEQEPEVNQAVLDLLGPMKKKGATRAGENMTNERTWNRPSFTKMGVKCSRKNLR